jgi:hypothetical protein
MANTIQHTTTNKVQYPGSGPFTPTNTLSSSDWDAVHATLAAGAGIVITSDGLTPPTFTISSAGGNGTITGSGTNPFLAIWTSPTALGNSVFQDDGTAFKGTTDNVQDLGTLALKWRNYFGAGTVSAGSGFQTNAATGLTLGDNTKLQLGAGVNGGLVSQILWNPLLGGSGATILQNGSAVEIARWDNSTGNYTVSAGLVSSGSGFQTNAATALTVKSGGVINTNNGVSAGQLKFDLLQLLPFSDNTTRLGDVGATWSIVNAQILKAYGSIQANADNSIDVGTSSFRFRTGYFGTTISGGKAVLSAFQMNVGAVNNYVLTTDAAGNGTWQAAAGGVTSVGTGGTWLAKFASASSASPSIFQDDGTALKGTTDGFQDLGTSILRWRNAFFSNVVSVGTYASAADIRHVTVGNTGMHFNDDFGDFYFGYEYGVQPVALFGVNNDLRVGTNFSPLADNAQSLGSITRRWSNFFTTGSFRLSFPGQANSYMQWSHDGGNANLVSNLNGGGNNTFNLGTDIVEITGSGQGTVLALYIGGSSLVSLSRVITPDALTYNLQTNVGQAIQPDTDNARDIGQTGTPLRWRHGYYMGTVSVGAAGAGSYITSTTVSAGSFFTTNTSSGMRFGGTAVTAIKTATTATELIPVIINGVTRYIQTFQNSN